MVHVRYIKKRGKLHGPYYYESYREDGKVKKRYMGTVHPDELNRMRKKNSLKRVVLPLVLGIILLSGIILGIGYYEYQKNSVTGKITSENIGPGILFTGFLDFVRESFITGFQVECTENWQCTDWSSCSNSLQTRTCSDLNNCRTKTNKPA